MILMTEQRGRDVSLFGQTVAMAAIMEELSERNERARVAGTGGGGGGSAGSEGAAAAAAAAAAWANVGIGGATKTRKAREAARGNREEEREGCPLARCSSSRPRPLPPPRSLRRPSRRWCRPSPPVAT